ncbi:CHAT domain-containing protein [Saccharothrix stipae]
MEGLDPDVAKQLENPVLRDMVITMMLEEADREDATSPRRTTLLGSVGSLLYYRFTETGAAEDLDEAISTTGESVRGVDAGNPEHLPLLLNFVTMSLARYDRTTDRVDLDRAIDTGRQAAAIAPIGDPKRGQCLLELARALRRRSASADNHADLDDAIETHRLNLATLSGTDPIRASVYGMLINDLLVRSELGSNDNDLHRAVQVGQEAVGSLTDSVQRAMTGNNLALALNKRFDRFGALDDLTSAIDLFRSAAVALAGNGRVLYNLSYALIRRFERFADEADIHEAVTVGRAAVHSSDGDSTRTEFLRNLGNALMHRFSLSGGIEDVNEAILALRQAIDGLRSTAPALARAKYLGDLASALRDRFDRTGDRLARTGETTDLDEAIDALRDAVRMVPDDGAGKAEFLFNLSIALTARFHQTQRDEDIDQAVAIALDSLRVLPRDNRLWMKYQQHLASTLMGRFNRKNNTPDLDRAIEVSRTALDACPPDHPDRAVILVNLATSLLARCYLDDDPAACDEAISVYLQATQLTREGMPLWATSRTALGHALRKRFEMTAQVEDIDLAIEWWRTVATAGAAPVSERIAAAYLWGGSAAEQSKWTQALGGYTTAVDLLPMVAWRGASRADREKFVADWAGLATEAAAAAIAAGEPKQALQLLEQGRGVLWSQLLDARNDLAVLSATAPDLARRLAEVRAALDAPPPDTSAGTAQPWAERWVDRQLALVQEWEDLVRQARSTTGSVDALRQPAVEELLSVMHGEVVVVVNIARLRCDAIVITTNDIQVIPLPALVAEESVEQVNRYLTALHRHERASGDPAVHVEFELTITAMLEWLWDTTAEPVLTTLGHTSAPASDAHWPRLWWSPTGPLTLLPLHAAGYHDEGEDRAVLDRAISSYAPTLRALDQARASAARSSQAGDLLMVAMPTTPGQAPLPSVRREQDMLARLFGLESFTVLGEERADRLTVSRELNHHRWVHFACHGTQNPGSPSLGGFLLHDGFLTISDLSASHNERGEFAYLSACRTAVGGVAALDEAITTVAAFQHAGWQHVIGTLWAVSDDTAADVATDFYTEQFANGTFHPATAASSLHGAVRNIRDHARTRPSLWAPFVHVGP